MTRQRPRVSVTEEAKKELYARKGHDETYYEVIDRLLNTTRSETDGR